MNPACFGKPKAGLPCSGCGVRPECYGENRKRPVFLLPRARPVTIRQTHAGARLAVEDFCVACGPTQKMRTKEGVEVCARCYMPLESE